MKILSVVPLMVLSISVLWAQNKCETPNGTGHGITGDYNLGTARLTCRAGETCAMINKGGECRDASGTVVYRCIFGKNRDPRSIKCGPTTASDTPFSVDPSSGGSQPVDFSMSVLGVVFACAYALF
ncbi:hypothetical protein AX774_g1686 [Zancudomyces culisetae]|uniref:Secreted protein n=1 Tax=Zancudomyces culisetae TaxID=1213189 RepID=A0A1R1PV26_ZANCU|nr:hypothetical protein AX774_g4566 [Zancudomyces culisetae]OMH84779.1 hypothetical protein AX774_g1686 [Zancudomyces culisetae]|eukprot:OMH81969.1 hypothetical protein AX774_g4566 [Zancudomyces culisetae]